MATTADNVSFDWSMSSESSDFADRPYLTKELLYVIDNNGSPNYSRNQVQFETIALSNNGKWCDYRNGFVSIPLVTVVESSVDLDADLYGVQMKSGNHNIIDSIILDYGNNNVIQQNSNINAYLSFKSHTTLSQQDVLINGRTTGYRKDGRNWSFTDTGGMVNNDIATNPSMNHDSTFNDAQRVKVLSNTNAKASGDDVYEMKSARLHVYYHDCIIRLKDLFFFEKLPMVRGANVKITINLSQSKTSYTVNAGNAVTAVSSLTLNGATQPIIRRMVDKKARSETVTVRVVSNGPYTYDPGSGSDVTETFTHEKKQCRLYVPVYTYAPEAEKQYLSLGQKKIVYEDVFVQHIRNLSPGNFQNLLTNSLARMQRLVIVPMLSKSANGSVGAWTPQESLTATEPSTCSPCFIRDFNVQLSGSNLYKQNIQYKYEMFLNELNGNYGTNANMVDGVTSSMIDVKDFNNNYGYIVVDLSRRYSYDEFTPMSVQIQGNIASPKALDFLCFITYTKDVTIDLVTGQQIV